MTLYDILRITRYWQKFCCCDEDFCFLLCPLSERPPEGEEDK